MAVPRLDTRTWEDLRRELIRRVPMHAPEWTDLGPADPGIALLELFAFLGEHLIRRMEQVPVESEGAFLRLLGMPRRPASRSRAWAAFSLTGASTMPVKIPFDPGSTRARVAAGPVEFQVCDELDVLPVESLVAIKRTTQGVSEDTRAEMEAIVGDHLHKNNVTPHVKPELAFYETVRLKAPVSGRLGDPVHLADTADGALWIALLVPEALAKQTSPVALRDRIRGRVLSLGVVVDAELSETNGGKFLLARAGGGGEAAPSVTWQISTGGFRSPEPRVDALRYEALNVVSDGTHGLSRTGVVRLRLPMDSIGTWAMLDDEGYPLAGLGELPPALDDPKLEARIIAWIRGYRPTESPPALRWAATNVVPIEQSVTQLPELLGWGNGQPGQVVTLSKAPVMPDSVALEVREADPTGWLLWRPVIDLAHSRGDDPHYVLDPVSGAVRFGDGIQGRMPRQDEAIRVRTYRAGGGAAGNVPAGAIRKIVSSEVAAGLAVFNPLPATGGRDGETDAEARARAPTALRNQDRAVAPSDFRELALLTPGLVLGRAEVLPLHKPDDRGVEVPGALTLIVIPAYDPAHPDEPAPDREALRRVIDWLEPRRLVTTELYVTRPEYVPLWLSVAIELEEGYGPSTVQGWVEMALRQHLAPLPPYGPAGQGWPMGREVRLVDLTAAALTVRGVRLVSEARLVGPNGSGPSVWLWPWQLPVVRAVTVAVASDAPDPTAQATPTVGRTGQLVVAVPVVREMC